MHASLVSELSREDDGGGVGPIPDPFSHVADDGEATSGAHPAMGAGARHRKDELSFFEFNVFGWNVGGAPLDCLGEALLLHAGRRVRADDLFIVQELSRRKLGWSVAAQGHLQEVSHRYKDQWRGDGLVYDPTAWAVVSRKAAGKGVWFRVKHLASAIELWLGSFHFTPGCNQIAYSEEVTGFLSKKPRDGLPVIVQGDANADVG